MKTLKVHLCNELAQLPQFPEPRGASFDLRACLNPGSKVRTFNPWNKEVEVPVKAVNGTQCVQIYPGYRVMIPTGLSFDVDPDHVVKVYALQDMAVKHGTMFINGIILVDHNHTGEVLVNLYNTSDGPITINNGDAIARAMLERLEYYNFEEITDKPNR